VKVQTQLKTSNQKNLLSRKWFSREMYSMELIWKGYVDLYHFTAKLFSKVSQWIYLHVPHIAKYR